MDDETFIDRLNRGKEMETRIEVLMVEWRENPISWKGWTNSEATGRALSMGKLADQIRAEERRAWADYLENWESTVGSPALSVSRLATLLREDERPFGAAASDIAADRG